MVYIIAISIGMISVLQSTLNRHIADIWGLSSTLVVAGITMLVSCLFLYAAVKFYPDLFPDFFRNKSAWTQFKIWYLIPGILGLLIVLGFPFAISKIGATSVFILAIVGQIAASVVWDVCIEKIPLNHYRLIAIALCATGAYLSTKTP